MHTTYFDNWVDKMAALKRVMLIIETSRSFGRGCLTGIAGYVRSHGSWDIYQRERASDDDVSTDMKKWNPDGVIARIENQSVADAICELNVPTVDLRCHYKIDGVARITTASESCAQKAIEHFIDRGHRKFAYCGFPGVDFSEDRCRFFCKLSAEIGIEPILYSSMTRREDVDNFQVERRESDTPQIVEWLRSLPKPIAVLTCNDVRGRQILKAARNANIDVPSEVAVLGVDDDEVLCELSYPALSSVSPNTRQVGFEAAAMLSGMMCGDPPPARTVYLLAGPVIVRQSSDVIAVDDLLTSSAMGYIRDRACEGITVSDVASAMSVSRATLDRRFAEFAHRSASEELSRVRMARAKQLLVDTDYDLETVSEMSGYGSASHFSVAFKRRLSVTPGEYRKAITPRMLG